MKRSRSQRGMTLIEMMVAIGIGAVALYAVTTILWHGAKDTTSLTQKNEFNDLISNIQTRFDNPVLCLAMLQNQAGITVQNSDGSTTVIKGQTSIPSLASLGAPGPSTSPVPITLDLGNVDANHQGTAQVYTAGTKLTQQLTILKFEFTGKTPANLTSTLDANGNTIQVAVAGQYEIPLHILASRRLGGYTTSTQNTTATDTATGSVTVTSVSGLTPVNTSGAATSTGGDFVEKTMVLRVTMDATGSVITGCQGQNNVYWKPKPSAKQNVQFVGANNSTDAFAVGIGPQPQPPCPASNPSCVFPDHSQFYLDVNGQAWAQNYAYNSDARLKQNVREIPHALDRVEKLHGVLFDWKEPESDASQGDQIGFLAQEVEQAFPEAVSTSPATGMKSVGYENLLAPMVEALKERQKTLVQQENDMAEIRKTLGKAN